MNNNTFKFIVKPNDNKLYEGYCFCGGNCEENCGSNCDYCGNNCGNNCENYGGYGGNDVY